MEWCLDCHRAPEKYLRPIEVFNMRYEQPTSEKPLAMDGRTFTDQDPGYIRCGSSITCARLST